MKAGSFPFPEAGAEVKLLCATTALIVVLGASSPRVGLVVGAAAIGSLALAAVPRGTITRGLGGPAFLLAVTVGLKAMAAGAAGFRSDAGRLALADAGLLAARVAGACLVMRWLVASTTPASLGRALVRFGAPRDFVEVLALAARYAEMLQQDGARLMASATLRLGFRSFATVARVAPAIAGSLVVRATERAEAVARVLALRGYHGELPVGPREASNPRAAMGLCLASVATLALALVVGHWS